MASGQNIVVSTVLLLGMGGIFIWMKQNGVSSTDMSLNEACAKAVDAGFTNVETCEDIVERGFTWETKIPCYEGFKESKYFWTPLEIAGGNWREALIESGEACQAQVAADADFETFQKVQAAQKGRAKKRVLGGGTNGQYGAGPNAGQVTKQGSNSPGWGSGIYKACSAARIAAGVQDRAECSGNPHLYDGEDGYCHNAFYNGHSQMSTVHGRGFHLAYACIIHDICLQAEDWKTLEGFTGYAYNRGCKGCDKDLSARARLCALRSTCNDSNFQARKVWDFMALAPNRLYDDKGCDCTETCCGGYMGNGSYEGWCCPGGPGGQRRNLGGCIYRWACSGSGMGSGGNGAKDSSSLDCDTCRNRRLGGGGCRVLGGGGGDGCGYKGGNSGGCRSLTLSADGVNMA